LSRAQATVIVRTELLLVIVFLPMVVEAWRASRNERAQRARGGIEPPGDVYRLMRAAYPLAFLAMIAEGFLRGGASSPLFGAGAVLFAAAKLLKTWAIASLGDAWTFRVIIVPGASRIAHGPYRYISHPNYVGVVGELAGVAMMTRAAIAGPLVIAGFGALLARRIAVERAALDAILAPTDEPGK
jgi:methyltransferase